VLRALFSGGSIASTLLAPVGSAEGMVSEVSIPRIPGISQVSPPPTRTLMRTRSSRLGIPLTARFAFVGVRIAKSEVMMVSAVVCRSRLDGLLSPLRVSRE
jgi:hypothetical protein